MFRGFRFKVKSRCGYTLSEVLTVAGIIILIGLVTGISLFGRRNQADLEISAKSMVALLREAQSKAVAQTGSVAWGVHFENSNQPYYAMFSGGAYASTTQVGYYHLPASVIYATSTLASGASLDVVFNKLDGTASATIITLNLASNSERSATVSIGSLGTAAYTLSF